MLDENQKRIVKFIDKKKRVQINGGMGIGKTLATLTHIAKVIKNGKAKKILVIAPPLVADNVWSDEVEKWIPHLKVIKLTGTPLQNEKALLLDCDINTISVDRLHQLDSMVWDYVVFDESSLFKNHASNRFKNIKRLFKISKPKYIVNLTGTPAPNGYLNLWSQYFMLDGGKKLGKNITAYRNKYFNKVDVGYAHIYQIKPKSDKKINKKIKKLTLGFEVKDVVGVQLNYNYIKLKLNKKLQAKYDEFEKEFIYEYDNDDMIVADSSAILSMKLLQFSNGSIINTETKETTPVHDLKIKALKTLIRYVDGNIIVMYNFKNDRDRIMNEFKNAQSLETNKNLINDWNNGKVKIMVVHPASIGHGLNLQTGGSDLVWYGMSWNLEHYQQTNKRLHRRGQLNDVNIHHLIVGKVEDKVIRRLREKDVVQTSIMRVGI